MAAWRALKHACSICSSDAPRRDRQKFDRPFLESPQSKLPPLLVDIGISLSRQHHQWSERTLTEICRSSQTCRFLNAEYTCLSQESRHSRLLRIWMRQNLPRSASFHLFQAIRTFIVHNQRFRKPLIESVQLGGSPTEYDIPVIRHQLRLD